MRKLTFGPALLATFALLLFAPLITLAQNYTSLNYFEQCAAGASTCDNVLNVNGTLKFDSKATNIDHGLASLNASGYATVTTNLTSIVDCTLTFKGVAAPSTGGRVAIAMFTTGSAVLEITAWKVTSSGDDTLIPASATSSVSYACFGT